jgi:hypothetical protein
MLLNDFFNQIYQMCQAMPIINNLNLLIYLVILKIRFDRKSKYHYKFINAFNFHRFRPWLVCAKKNIQKLTNKNFCNFPCITNANAKLNRLLQMGK